MKKVPIHICADCQVDMEVEVCHLDDGTEYFVVKPCPCNDDKRIKDKTSFQRKK